MAGISRRDEEDKLLAGDLHYEDEPLPDRATDEPGSSPEAGAIVVANFPKAERRLRLSRTGLCYSAIIPEVLTA